MCSSVTFTTSCACLFSLGCSFDNLCWETFSAANCSDAFLHFLKVVLHACDHWLISCVVASVVVTKLLLRLERTLTWYVGSWCLMSWIGVSITVSSSMHSTSCKNQVRRHFTHLYPHRLNLHLTELLDMLPRNHFEHVAK